MTSRKRRHQKTSAMSPKVTGYHDCGNPPGWTGHLRALHVRCGTARYVFKHIRCSNSRCTRIHSGRWACISTELANSARRAG